MTILDRILTDTRALVEQRKQVVSRQALEDAPSYHAPRRSLEDALRGDELAFIAEIKKASPSKGVIRSDFDVRTIARQYAENGAAALSILTEPRHFEGNLAYLGDAREMVTLPLLRKDFIIDAYQLYEARAHSADAVLLIAAAFDRQKLYDLHAEATALGLECLVEVYEMDELDRLDFEQVRILGVNNRDLRTFEVDIDHSLRVFEQAPPSVVRVSESGLRTGADLAHLRRHGIDAVLIGEAFMRAPNPGEALARLRSELNSLLSSKAPSKQESRP